MTSKILVDKDNVISVIDVLNYVKVIVLDTETNMTDKWHDRYMLGFSAYEPVSDIAYYFPVKHPNIVNLDSNCLHELKPKHMIFHNAKFDLHVFRRAGFKFADSIVDDTFLMSYVINEEPPHGLKELSDKLIHAESSKDQDLIKIVMKGYAWEDIPVEIMAMYATQDVVLTWKLYQYFNNKIARDEVLARLYAEDLEFMFILSSMERAGIEIDPIEARIKSAKCVQRCAKIEMQLGYNPNKRIDLAKRLFGLPPEGLGLKPIEFKQPTKTFPGGFPATGSAILEQLHHPEVGLVLEYRRTDKIRSTYYDGWLSVIDDMNMIHPTYNQCGTVTGRLSCNNPNMQNIPRDSSENDVKKEYPVKKLLRAFDGFSIWELDYSQMELRLASVYAEEEEMLRVFNEGGDPHQLMADSLDISRQVAKMVNFLLPYGGGANRLYESIKAAASQGGSMTLSLQDCYRIHEKYHSTYPGFSRMSLQCAEAMFQKRYIQYWNGRRRRMKYDHHKAWNSLIQGGAAEIMRSSMRKIIAAELSNSVMIAQVHDSLWIRTSDVKELTVIKELMEWPTEAFGLAFPVDIKQLA